eukprot:2066774-Rhodomonas_salina.2
MRCSRSSEQGRAGSARCCPARHWTIALSRRASSRCRWRCSLARSRARYCTSPPGPHQCTHLPPVPGIARVHAGRAVTGSEVIAVGWQDVGAVLARNVTAQRVLAFRAPGARLRRSIISCVAVSRLLAQHTPILQSHREACVVVASGERGPFSCTVVIRSQCRALPAAVDTRRVVSRVFSRGAHVALLATIPRIAQLDRAAGRSSRTLVRPERGAGEVHAIALERRALHTITGIALASLRVPPLITSLAGGPFAPPSRAGPHSYASRLAFLRIIHIAAFRQCRAECAAVKASSRPRVPSAVRTARVLTVVAGEAIPRMLTCSLRDGLHVRAVAPIPESRARLAPEDASLGTQRVLVVRAVFTEHAATSGLALLEVCARPSDTLGQFNLNQAAGNVQ